MPAVITVLLLLLLTAATAAGSQAAIIISHPSMCRTHAPPPPPPPGLPAGFVSCTCTYPLDLARACLAVERHPGGGTTGAGQQHSVLYILRKAYQEGVRTAAAEKPVVVMMVLLLW